MNIIDLTESLGSRDGRRDAVAAVIESLKANKVARIRVVPGTGFHDVKVNAREAGIALRSSRTGSYPGWVRRLVDAEGKTLDVFGRPPRSVVVLWDSSGTPKRRGGDSTRRCEKCGHVLPALTLEGPHRDSEEFVMNVNGSLDSATHNVLQLQARRQRQAMRGSGHTGDTPNGD